jgi:hypothetical protein
MALAALDDEFVKFVAYGCFEQGAAGRVLRGV